jgi:Thermostable hemolysin
MPLPSGPHGLAAERALPSDCAAAMPSWRQHAPALALPSPRRAVDGSLQLHDHGADDRAAVEQFIRQRYSVAFGSTVQRFMPRLHSLRNREGLICGAFGLRGSEQPLFLEQYLDVPIEAAIAARTGQACARAEVIEVGHLSGAYPGAVRTMIALVTRRLHRDGLRWVAFTGTATLRNAFHRLGLTPLELGPATADRLPETDRQAWGRYYDDRPQVFVGNVSEGHRLLSGVELPLADVTGASQ